MEECWRTRSQGPPSLSEGNEARQWASIPDLLQIEREHVEALRLARQVNTGSNMSKNTVENSEISQTMSQQIQYIENMLPIGEILPKQQQNEGHSQIAPKMGEILPRQPHKQLDLETMEEGAVGNMPERSIRESQNITHHIPIKSDSNPQQESPHQSSQGESAQQFLDDYFSYMMRSSAIGSNVSSLFNATTFTTTHNEQKITLDWILPDGKNS